MLGPRAVVGSLLATLRGNIQEFSRVRLENRGSAVLLLVTLCGVLVEPCFSCRLGSPAAEQWDEVIKVSHPGHCGDGKNCAKGNAKAKTTCR